MPPISERNFYEAIADEEREHELILVHYNEYLTDRLIGLQE